MPSQHLAVSSKLRLNIAHGNAYCKRFVGAGGSGLREERTVIQSTVSNLRSVGAESIKSSLGGGGGGGGGGVRSYFFIPFPLFRMFINSKQTKN